MLNCPIMSLNPEIHHAVRSLFNATFTPTQTQMFVSNKEFMSYVVWTKRKLSYQYTIQICACRTICNHIERRISGNATLTTLQMDRLPHGTRIMTKSLKRTNKQLLFQIFANHHAADLDLDNTRRCLCRLLPRCR